MVCQTRTSYFDVRRQKPTGMARISCQPQLHYTVQDHTWRGGFNHKNTKSEDRSKENITETERSGSSWLAHDDLQHGVSFLSQKGCWSGNEIHSLGVLAGEMPQLKMLLQCYFSIENLTGNICPPSIISSVMSLLFIKWSLFLSQHLLVPQLKDRYWVI